MLLIFQWVSKVSGESSGVEILGIFTIGASETADGVDVSSRGETLNRNRIFRRGYFFSPLHWSLLHFFQNHKKFKAAALRDACDSNNCDV